MEIGKTLRHQGIAAAATTGGTLFVMGATLFGLARYFARGGFYADVIAGVAGTIGVLLVLVAFGWVFAALLLRTDPETFEEARIKTAKERLRAAGLWGQFRSQSGKFALGVMFVDQSFDRQQLEQLGQLGVIKREQVQPSPHPPLGGIPTIADTGFAYMTLTELGTKVIQDADD